MRNRRCVVFASLLTACAPPFDPTRTESDPGSFGEHVVTLLCKRLAFQADPTDVAGDTYRASCQGGDLPADPAPPIVALETDRARTIAAIDAAVPASTTDALQAYLTSDAVLALYDDDTMATSIVSLGDMLDELATDDPAMGALARLGAHDGYRRADVAIGQLGPMLSSIDVPTLLDRLLPMIDTGGAAKPAWDSLVAAIAATMADASAPADPANSTAAIVNTLLLTEHAELGETAALPIVARDSTGTAIAAAPTEVTPFATIGDTAMRDPDGRAIDATGKLLYQYLDVTKTLIGAMGTDTRTLLDPMTSTAIDLVRGASLLVGDRAPQTRTFDDGSTLAYQGYDTSQSPLLDLAYAFAQLLRDALATDTLALSDQLFGAHQAATARLVEAAISAARLGDTFPAAEILADAPLWDDLRPLLQQITADPTLVANLLAALQRPEVALLADRFREFMTYSDRFDIAADQSVTGGLAAEPDRTQPDTGFNRSLFERLLNVISDSNGAKQCNKQGAVLKQNGLTVATYNACAFFEIDNLAVFYLQSIVYAKDASGNIVCEDNGGQFDATKSSATAEGCAAFGAGWRPRPKANFNYNWNNGLSSTLVIGTLGGDAYVEQNATITGFRTHPTPEALNRVLFLDPTPQAIQDTSDPMRDKDGDLYKEQHAGTLPVWEKNNFYDEVRPVMQAFADANQEQTFVDFLSVLNKHWSSKLSTSYQHTDPTAGNYVYGSNAESYEPYIVAILQGDLWPALTQTSAELTAITANGKPLAQIAAHAGNYLTTPQAGLTDRLGRATSTTSDGRPVAQLTPWQLLADAYVAKRARLAASTDGALWTDSTKELVDLLFRGSATGGWHFANAHTATMTRALTQLVRDRLAAHADVTTWLGKTLPQELADFFTHPILAAANDFITAIDGPPRAALEQLLFDLFDPSQPAYQTMRASTASLIQLAVDSNDLVPLGYIVGQLLAKSYLPQQVSLLARLHAADGDKTLDDIVARLFSADEPGVPVISAIADAVGDVDRVAPGPLPPWAAADYASTLHTVAAFFKEQQRGLLRFIAIVKGRNP